MIRQFLDKNPLPIIDYSNLNDFTSTYLKHGQEAVKALGQPPPGVTVTELQYPTRDGALNRAKLFKPDTQTENGSPLIMMIHGGGFCLGAPEGEEQTCRNFVLAFGATCVSISYRLAPKYQYPYAPNDCWDALQWCAANAQSWGADTSAGFCVGGTSAGGNLAAILAHKARDSKLTPPLTGQYLAIPLICPPSKMPEAYRPWLLSYKQNEYAPFLPKAAIDMFINEYKPDLENGVDFAILNHPDGHKDLPRAFFQLDGMDPLRDEAIIYERVLREESGVETRLDIYPGVPHGHWTFFSFLKVSRTFRKEQLEGIGWLLGKEPDFSKIDLDPAAASV